MRGSILALGTSWIHRTSLSSICSTLLEGLEDQPPSWRLAVMFRKESMYLSSEWTVVAGVSSTVKIGFCKNLNVV